MGEKTAISWCDHTFNPWWGCTKVSAECTNCYAETFDERVGGRHWGDHAHRRFFGEKHWLQPLKWDRDAMRAGERRRVFCASMADVFEDRDDLDESRANLWELILATPHLDWLLLSKRPENMERMIPWGQYGIGPSPWPNVWLGTTAGTVESLDRVMILRTVPAVQRFVSCEPLLEEITAADWDMALASSLALAARGIHPITWLIVGNESGPRRRPADIVWVQTARDAAARHNIAFHFKQWVAPNGKVTHLPMLDGVQHAEFPQ